MAEPVPSGASSPATDTDVDFDPSADMLIHDYDDEQTLDEEEAMSNDESVANELDDLQKEGDMPIEQLLAMYGYNGDQAPPPPPPVIGAAGTSADLNGSSSGGSSSEDEDETTVVGVTVTVRRSEGPIRRDEGSIRRGPPGEAGMPTSRLLRSDVMTASSDEDDDDYDPDDETEYWKKCVQVGSDYQCVVPEGLSHYNEGERVYENDDELVWDPSHVTDVVVEQYIGDIHKHSLAAGQGVYSVPTGAHVKDDEQALFLLLQCGYDVNEAKRRHKLQSAPATDPMSLWSEEECRNFESGLRTFGKDFFQIQLNKVQSRSVGQLIQFYYLWKKTERHDAFAARTRLEKKKYTLHPGITDYMDRFLDDQDNPVSIDINSVHNEHDLFTVIYNTTQHIPLPDPPAHTSSNGVVHVTPVQSPTGVTTNTKLVNSGVVAPAGKVTSPVEEVSSAVLEEVTSVANQVDLSSLPGQSKGVAGCTVVDSVSESAVVATVTDASSDTVTELPTACSTSHLLTPVAIDTPTILPGANCSLPPVVIETVAVTTEPISSSVVCDAAMLGVSMVTVTPAVDEITALDSTTTPTSLEPLPDEAELCAQEVAKPVTASTTTIEDTMLITPAVESTPVGESAMEVDDCSSVELSLLHSDATGVSSSSVPALTAAAAAAGCADDVVTVESVAVTCVTDPTTVDTSLTVGNEPINDIITEPTINTVTEPTINTVTEPTSAAVPTPLTGIDVCLPTITVTSSDSGTEAAVVICDVSNTMPQSCVTVSSTAMDVDSDISFTATAEELSASVVVDVNHAGSSEPVDISVQSTSETGELPAAPESTAVTEQQLQQEMLQSSAAVITSTCIPSEPPSCLHDNPPPPNLLILPTATELVSEPTPSTSTPVSTSAEAMSSVDTLPTTSATTAEAVSSVDTLPTTSDPVHKVEQTLPTPSIPADVVPITSIYQPPSECSNNITSSCDNDSVLKSSCDVDMPLKASCDGDCDIVETSAMLNDNLQSNLGSQSLTS